MAPRPRLLGAHQGEEGDARAAYSRRIVAPSSSLWPLFCSCLCAPAPLSALCSAPAINPNFPRSSEIPVNLTLMLQSSGSLAHASALRSTASSHPPRNKTRNIFFSPHSLRGCLQGVTRDGGFVIGFGWVCLRICILMYLASCILYVS